MAKSECQECKLYKLEAMSQGSVLQWNKAIHPEEKDYSTFLQTVNALMNEDGGGILIHTDNPYLLDMFDQKVDKKLRELIPDNSPFLTWFDRQLLDRQHVFFRVKTKNGDRPLSVYAFNLKTPLNEGLCEPRYGEVTHRISEVLMRRPDELTEESSYESPVFKRGDEVVYERDSGKIPFQECAWLQAKYFDCFSECNPDSREGAKAAYKKTLQKNNTLEGNSAVSKRSDEIVGKLLKHDLPGYISAFSGIYQFGGGSVYCGVQEEKGAKWKEQKKETFSKKQHPIEIKKKTTKSTVQVAKGAAGNNTTPGTTLNKSSSGPTRNKAKSDAKGNNCSPSTTNNATSGASENNATSGVAENNATSGAKGTNATSGATQINATPGATEKNATSDASENNATSGATQINATPGATENNATSGATENNATSDTTENNATSDASENNATSDASENNATSDATENNATSDTTENNATSDTTENNATPGATEINSTENSATPGATEINSTENSATPGVTEINSTENNATPSATEINSTENNATPGATEINSTENDATPGATEINSTENDATPVAKGFTRDEATIGTPVTVATTYVPGNGATVFVVQEERLQGAKQEETKYGSPNEETNTNSKAEGHGIATENKEIPHKEDTVFCCKGVHLSDDEKRQLTQTLGRKLKHSLFWCGRSKPCKPIAFIFYKVGNPEENLYVFEVKVHYYHGLCFQSGRGPVAYKLLGESLNTQMLENKEQKNIPDADKLKDEKERGIARYEFKEWAERCRMTEEDILDEQEWDGIIDVQDRCGYNGMQGDACG